MMDKLKISEALKMDFGNLISCIECHAEEKNLEVIKETLKTIVNICAEEKLGKDAFREVGGLDFLLDFLLNTDEVIILEYCLNVIAFVIDGNVPNQMHLTEERIFKILQAVFEKKSYPLKVLKNAIVLFSTILFQNRLAQDLAYQNGNIQSLTDLYKSFYPICNNFIDPEDSERLQIWLDINRSLCFAVNNPLNEKNQEVCSMLFPMALKLIEISVNSEIIEASSLFLSLSISNNVKNQDAFAEHDGFLILKRSLNKTFEEIQIYMNECNNMISKEILLRFNSLLSVISDSVLDHEKNASFCGKLGIVSILVKFLYTEVLDLSITKKVFLALGYCIDAYRENRFIILDNSHFDVLLKKNLESNDQELHSAARYLLQVCLDESGKNREGNDCIDTESHNDFPLSFAPKENSEPFKNLEDITPSCSNNLWNNMKQQNKSDCFKNLLDIPAFLTPFQERTNEGNCFGLRMEPTMYTEGQQENGKDLLFSKKGSSKYDSESELSLQSAGHFYRTQKMKRKQLKNKCKSHEEAFKSTNRTKHSSSAKENLPEIDMKEYNCDIKKIASESTSREKYFSLENNKGKSVLGNAEKQEGIVNRPNNKNKINSIRRKSIELNPSELSLELNRIFDTSTHSSKKDNFGCENLDEAWKLSFRNVLAESVESKIIKNTESKKNMEEKTSVNIQSGKNSSTENITSFMSPSASKDSTTPIQEKANFNSHTLSEKDFSNADTYNESNKVSNECDRFKLNDSSRPCSSSRKDSSGKPKSSRQHPPGCVEVIVLPGTVCCDHKLASMIEYLKVCPIEKEQCQT